MSRRGLKVEKVCKKAHHKRDNAVLVGAGLVLKYLAGACAMAGLLVAATGALRAGALLFASAVALFGTGRLLAGAGDRAVDLVILFIGMLSVIGVVGHLLTGL